MTTSFVHWRITDSWKPSFFKKKIKAELNFRYNVVVDEWYDPKEFAWKMVLLISVRLELVLIGISIF